MKFVAIIMSMCLLFACQQNSNLETNRLKLKEQELNQREQALIEKEKALEKRTLESTGNEIPQKYDKPQDRNSGNLTYIFVVIYYTIDDMGETKHFVKCSEISTAKITGSDLEARIIDEYVSTLDFWKPVKIYKREILKYNTYSKASESRFALLNK